MTQKFGLLVASILFAIVACELAVRYVHKAWPFEVELQSPPYLTSRDAPLRWRFSPADKRNRLGLRNREVAAKGAGVYLILFLGDSLVYSGDTSSGELYTEVLERRLNQSRKEFPVIEVINAGIPGYTTY